MASATDFWHNLLIVDQRRHVQGCVIECGVWRGGMSAGIAEVLGADSEYFLQNYRRQQQRMGSGRWHGKEMSKVRPTMTIVERQSSSERAMRLSSARKYEIVKGWFKDTLPKFVPPCPITILRLDGDWYDSTLLALETLFKYVAQDGIVIVDDYYAWDGCSIAVHDFLSRHRLKARLTQKFGICVLEPRP